MLHIIVTNPRNKDLKLGESVIRPNASLDIGAVSDNSDINMRTLLANGFEVNLVEVEDNAVTPENTELNSSDETKLDTKNESNSKIAPNKSSESKPEKSTAKKPETKSDNKSTSAKTDKKDTSKSAKK